MRIIILNGNPSAENISFDDYLEALRESLESTNHRVDILELREMDVRYCVGCFGCFVKTPGECISRDGSRDICFEYLNSDFVLFASPIIMGFTSALLKKVHDKLLPLMHPYFDLFQNQMHHINRYDKYPRIGLLLGKGEDSDEEDIKIVSNIYVRDAVNLNTSLCFSKLTTDPVDEVVNEINRI
jgi:multimeric flavodoxin WrbA